MPRQRRTHKAHVDLAILVERAQQQQQQHPYSGRPSRVQSRHTRAHIRSNRSRSQIVRSAHTSRNAVIGVSTHAVWNTLVQPISLLQWLPLRRSMRIRRSCRSRSRRSQRNQSEKNKSKTDLPENNSNVPKIDSQSPKSDGVVETPCCVTESPTTEVQMISDNEEQNRQQQCSEKPTLTPPLSTLILHQNPLFDAEGNTRSGLINRNIEKAKFDKVKTRWNVRCDKTTQQSVSTTEPQDAAKKKKTAAEKKVPAKKGSCTEDSSTASLNSPSSADSAASSEKSKTDTEESNSFDDGIDSTTQSPADVKLEDSQGVGTTEPASNLNATVITGSMVESSGPSRGTILPQQLKDESVSMISANNDGTG